MEVVVKGPLVELTEGSFFLPNLGQYVVGPSGGYLRANARVPPVYLLRGRLVLPANSFEKLCCVVSPGGCFFLPN